MASDRELLPYEKVAEETAKSVGKALDLIKSMSPAIAETYGLLIGDRISEARRRQLDALARKTKKLLHERHVKEEQEIAEQVAIPLLEAAQGETREELQNLYAALLANAMDPQYAEIVRSEFIETIRQWQPMDARIMKEAFEKRKTNKPSFDEDAARSFLGEVRLTAAQVSLAHLVKLDCLRQVPTGGVRHQRVWARGNVGVLRRSGSCFEKQNPQSA